MLNAHFDAAAKEYSSLLDHSECLYFVIKKEKKLKYLKICSPTIT